MKKAFSFMVAFTVCFGSIFILNLTAKAESNKALEDIYVESGEISLNDIELSINNNQLRISPKVQSYEVTRNMNALVQQMKTSPSLETQLVEYCQSDSYDPSNPYPLKVGYSSVYLKNVEQDGYTHTEPMTISEVAEMKAAEDKPTISPRTEIVTGKAGNGKLTMYVSAQMNRKSNFPTIYMDSMVWGEWTDGFSIFGDNVPATGDDFEINTVPDQFLVIDDDFSYIATTYMSHNYYRWDAKDHSVCYAFREYYANPTSYMTYVATSTTSKRDQSSTNDKRDRNFYGTYIHTWKELSPSFGMSGNEISPDFGQSSQKWQVAARVTYNC